MTPPDEAHPSDVVRFAVFEVDLRSGELRKSGVRIRLQDQPFRLLRILLAHPGEVVTREELQREIWPSDTFVDFDRGLNNAIKRLREALGDTAESPRYIETLPKRGYRFIAPLLGLKTSEPAPPLEFADESAIPTATAASRRGQVITRIVVGALALPIIVGAVGLAFNAGGLRNRLFGRTATPASDPMIHALAVIPLTNLSADPAQEYLSDGITDSLITELAQLRGIRVISRTSVMHYKKTEKTVPEIARELNVDGIVEGTVQRSGDRVRITAQLIYAPVERHVWANVYERDLKDVFVLERDLAAEIARRVRTELSSGGHPPVSHPRQVNVKAFEAYLLGKQLLKCEARSFCDKEMKEAAPYFQRAIDLDGNFVQAYRGLVDAHCYQLYPLDEKDVDTVTRARQKIAELDRDPPNSPDAWLASAGAKRRNGDFAGAEQEYLEHIQLEPNDATAHRAYANFLDDRGRLEEGWREQLIAQEVDPGRMGPGLDFPMALVRRHRYDEAIEYLSHILESDPNEGQSHNMLAECYKEKGKHQEEIEELGRGAAAYGFPDVSPRLQRAYAASGYAGAMRQYAREAEAAYETGRFQAPDFVSQLYLNVGDRDRAYHLLEVAYQSRARRSPCTLDFDPVHTLARMKKDPSYNSDPRFLDLLRRIGFPQ